MRKKITMGIVAFLMLTMVACNHKKEDSLDATADLPSGVVTPAIEALSGETVLTVNNLEVSYDELRLYLQSHKEEIESIYGSDVWDMPVNLDGKYYEDLFKEELIKEVIYIKLVCSQANELGISLTEDELLDVDEYTSEFMSNFDEETANYYQVKEEIVRQIYMDNVLSNKVFESLTLNVDTQVSEEEARQAVFWYILVGKYGYDQEGNRFEYSQEQLEEAQKRAQDLYEQAQTVSKFYDFALANSDNEDEVEIVVGKGDMKAPLEEVAFALKAGELSPVIDTEDGFFIFYCVEEMNQEETDAKREEIIRKRQEEAFDEKYKEWDAAKQVSIDEGIWDLMSLAGEIVQ